MTEKNGFTLIEVLVALAILSLSIGALLKVASTGVARIQESETEQQASALAQSLLARAGNDIPLTDGDAAGVEGDGLKWSIHVAPYGSVNDHAAWSSDAKDVTVTVSWGAAGRHLSLNSLRLLPETH